MTADAADREAFDKWFQRGCYGSHNESMAWIAWLDAIDYARAALPARAHEEFQFFRERLTEWLNDSITDQSAVGWYGHVAPSLERLAAMLSAAPPPPEQGACPTCSGRGLIGAQVRFGDGEVDGIEERCPDCSPLPSGGDVRRLREALAPFADFADALNEEAPDNTALGLIISGGVYFGPGSPTIGDLRRARAALAAPPPPGQGGEASLQKAQGSPEPLASPAPGPAEPVVRALEWGPEMAPNSDSSYTHIDAPTSLGLARIEWKGGKARDWYTCYLGDEWLSCEPDLEAAKAAIWAEIERRVRAVLSPEALARLSALQLPQPAPAPVAAQPQPSAEPVAYMQAEVLAAMRKDKTVTGTACSGLLRKPFGNPVPLYTDPPPPASDERVAAMRLRCFDKIKPAIEAALARGYLDLANDLIGVGKAILFLPLDGEG